MLRQGIYDDRRAAGRDLARHLKAYAGRDDVVVLGLPRGGIPVAYEVARALHAPLDAFVVRKLGYPMHEELAVGAVASGGTVVLDRALVVHLTQADLDAMVRKALAELQRREAVYRGGRPMPAIAGKTVILVDDGLATGSTMLAAIRTMRKLGPEKVVVAVPVASPHAVDLLTKEADEVVSPSADEGFYAVGQYYADFSPTTDAEVRTLLASSAEERRR